MLLGLMKANYKSIFGWSNVLSNYSFADFLKDAWLPSLVASLLLLLAVYNKVDMYLQVKSLLELGITIIPSMVALIVAAYTIMLSFLLSDKISSIKEKTGGREFIQNINSSFAMCLLISILTIILMIVFKGISCMELEVEPKLADAINYVAYFIITFLLTYSVFILVGIVVDIYNSGQTSLL